MAQQGSEQGPSDDAPPPAQTSAPATAPVVGSRRTAFTGGAWSAASTVAPMVGTLALSIVISRELGATVLGEQSLVAYVASMLFSVVIYSVTSASVQLLATSGGAGDTVRSAHLARWSFGAHLVSGGVSASVLITTGLLRSDFQVLWFLAAATAVVDAIGWAHASRDIARRGWRATSTRRLAAQGVSPFMGIAAIYAGFGVEGVFTVQLVVAVVLLVFLRRLDRGLPHPEVTRETTPARRPVVTLWAMIALAFLIVQIVERRIELIFLDFFHDAETVAMFSVAFNVVGIPLLLCASLIGAAMPAIASRHAREPELVQASLSRATRVVLAINLVLTAGVVAVGPSLVSLAYGPGFEHAAELVRFLGLTLLLAPLANLCVAFWTGTGRLRPVLLAGGIGAVVDISLCLLLIPAMAADGAVIATISAQATTAIIITTLTFRSGLRLRVRPGRLAAAALVVLVAGGAAAGVAVPLDGWWEALAATAVFGLLIAVGARFVGLFEPDDVDWLADTLPSRAEGLLRTFSPRTSGSSGTVER